LAVENEPTSSQFPKSYLDPEEDILLLEAILNDDHSFEFKTKSSFTSLNSLLEETNNFDNSLPEFTTFSNVLCDAEYEFDSSDDQSCSDEDVLEKIVLKPLSEEENIPMKSLRAHDSCLLISSMIDSLLDEFVGELALLKSIPPGIDEADCDFEEDIHLIEKLLYDNSSPHPPEEFVFANYDAKIKSFSPSPILVKDSDSLMEEIDLFCTPNYPMMSGIMDKDYDSKRDILISKDLPSNNTLSFAEKELFHFDIPLFSRPPAKPPDEFVSANYDAKIKSFSPSPILVKDSDSLMEEIDLFCTPNYPMMSGIMDKDYDSKRDILISKDLPSNNTLSFAEKELFHFDIPLFSRPPAKPPDGDTGILNIKMMGDNYDQRAFMHKIMITLASGQEKSPYLLSHRGLKTFPPFPKCPMMIHGQNNPILDVLLFHFYPP
nr:hypothetical protein [Tanacetum cinerariifolium]